MRGLFDSAYARTESSTKRSFILNARVHCDFLGISAQFNGSSLSSTNRARYLEMYNYIRNNGIELASESYLYSIPGSINYNQDPMKWYVAWASDSHPGTHRASNFD